MPRLPSSRRSPRFPAVAVAGLVALLACAIAGCRKAQSKGPDDATDSQATAPRTEPARPPRLLPAPPFLAKQLGRLDDQAMDKARLDLDQILQRLPRPDYLPPDEPADSGDAQHPHPDKPVDRPSGTDDTGPMGDASLAESSKPPQDAPPQAVKDYIDARLKLRQGELAEAKKLLRQVIQADPKAAAAFRMLGRLYLQEQDGSLASIYFRQAVRLDPHDTESLFHMGRLAFSEGQTDQAIVALATAKAHFKPATDPGLRDLVYYYLGKALMKQGYLEQAVEHYRRFLAVTSRFDRNSRYLRAVMLLGRQRPVMQLELADALVRLGRYEQALALYEELAGNQQINQRMLLPRLMYVDLVLHHDDRAISRLEGRIDWTRTHVATFRWIEYLHRHITDRDKLVQAMIQLYQKNRQAQPLALLLEPWLADEKRIDFLQKHLQEYPGQLKVYRRLVERLWPRQPAGVVQWTLERLQDHPDLAQPMLEVLMEDRDRRLALADVLKTLSTPLLETAAGWYCRGRALQGLGLFEQADKAYATALEKAPTFQAASWARIELKVLSGDHDQALAMLDAAPTDSPRPRLLRALLLLRTGQTDQAIALLDQLIAEDPSNVEYLNRKAIAQARKGDFYSAMQTFRKAISVDPTDEQAYAGLFAIFEKGKPDARQFLSLLEQLRQVLPDAPLVRLKTAQYHLMGKEYDKAEQVLRRLLDEHPGHAGALESLVNLLLQRDRAGQALTLLNRRLDAYPNDALALDLLRKTARQLFQPELFYRRYQAYLQQLPPTPENLLKLAKLYQLQNKHEQAIALVEQVLQQTREDRARLFVQLAELYQSAGRPEQALAALDRAEADGQGTDNQAVLLAILRAQMRHALKQQDKAIATLQQALVDHPKFRLDLQQALALLYVKMGRLEQAVAVADEMLAEHTDQAASMYYFKAQLYMLAGQPRQAEQMLLRSHQADPNYIPTNNDLGYTWAERGVHLDQAEQMIGKALQAEPNNAAYMDSMGWVLYKQGRFKQARLWLERAVKSPDGDNPECLDHLADTLWQLGQADKAVRYWRIAQQLLARQQQAGTERPDPDKMRLAETLKKKLQAVQADRTPPVAPVPRARPAGAAQATDG